MAFSKFDPHRPEPEERAFNATSDEAARRALILKYAWIVAWGYTVIGFGFIAYWLATG